MNSLTKASLCVAAVLAASPAFAGSPGFCSDPVVTHTNGMRLASTTSTRSHNVYWQCEPGHVGYCDGCLRSPCRDAWRSLGTRHHGRYTPPCTPMGPTSNETAHSIDGLESSDSESLGVLGLNNQTASVAPRRAQSSAGPAIANPAAPSAAPAQWLDAIQTIGRKMMPETGG